MVSWSRLADPTRPDMSSPQATGGLRLFPLLAAGAMILSPGEAQKPKNRRFKPDYWKEDPYTKNDDAAMKKAGYVSFGPFTWCEDHDTNDIKKSFPALEMLFVETAHFKIGSSLPAYTLPKGKRKLEWKILGEELTRLKKILPNVDPKLRTLDPWLRLHVFAMRMEEIYADFSRRLNVTDADFPKIASKPVADLNFKRRPYDPEDRSREFMGQGPYLGMRGKFLVLLMRKGGNLNRYAARARDGFRSKGGPKPQRRAEPCGGRSSGRSAPADGYVL